MEIYNQDGLPEQPWGRVEKWKFSDVRWQLMAAAAADGDDSDTFGGIEPFNTTWGHCDIRFTTVYPLGFSKYPFINHSERRDEQLVRLHAKSPRLNSN